MFKIITIIVLLHNYGTRAVLNPNGPTVINDFKNCIVSIMEMYFTKPGLVIFANTNNVSTSVASIRKELLEYIHRDLRYTVQIASPVNEVLICDQEVINEHFHLDHYEAIPVADYYIIIIDSYEDFNHLASKLIRSRTWNPKAKFVMLLFNFSDRKNNVNHVESILTCLFKFNAINIIVIVPEEKNIRNSIILSWRPYDPPKYCGYFNETAVNRSIIQNICEKGVIKYNNYVFEEKVPHNMLGCQIHVLALQRQPFISAKKGDPNIEKILINQVFGQIKIKTEFEIIDYNRGERNHNGQWDGALKFLTAKKAQILLGGIFPDYDVHEDFEYSTYYLADTYTWVVPRAYLSPNSVALIIIFQKIVWCCFIIVFITCVFIWMILGYLSDDSRYNKLFPHCFLNTWLCSLGQTSYKRPTKQALRIFYVSFNIYCVLTVTAYNTKLIDVLRNPTSEYQIQTVEELAASDLKFGGFEELRDLYVNSSDPFDNYIGEKWINIINITQALIDVVVHRNFSFLCSRLQLAHVSSVMPELSDSFGNNNYYTFDLDMFSVPLEMLALKGFALIDKFSNTISAFKQNGINSIIRRQFATINKRRRAHLLRSLDIRTTNVSPLSIEHLQGGFTVLILGFIIGSLLFLIEIACDNYYIKNIMLRCKKYVKID
uniref:Ionotropic receptor 60a n=1 Tax=Galleria mellonella TaxID=7137 RepID=A0A5C0E610_GALME|nr:ionotropic receptor 60a [Galleria mellonella]